MGPNGAVGGKGAIVATDMLNKAERDEAYLDEQINAWAFNVMLECSGRELYDAEIAIGGAVLNLHDLDKILTWAMGVRNITDTNQ